MADMRATLHAFQTDAARALVARFDRGLPGACLIAGTGLGKTRVAVASLHEIATRRRRRHRFRALCIVPSMAGAVVAQWRRELDAWGFQSLRLHQEAPAAGYALYTAVVVTIHGLLKAFRAAVAADADEARRPARTRRRLDDEGPEPLDPQLASAVLERVLGEGLPPARLPPAEDEEEDDDGAADVSDDRTAPSADEEPDNHVDVIVVDEFQMFRNGSNAWHADEDVDPRKPLYTLLDSLFRVTRPTFTLGTTATPLVNRHCDLFSFLRLFLRDEARPRKADWAHFPLAPTVQGRVAAAPRAAAARAQRAALVRAYLVSMALPAAMRVPDVERVTSTHGLTEIELAQMEAANDALAHSIRTHQAVVAATPAGASRHPSRVRAREGAFFALQACITRARRGLLHYAFYTPTPKTSAFMMVPADAPWSSRMQLLRERIVTMRKTHRVVVVMSYADPLVWLAEKLRATFVNGIYVYHSRVHKPQAVLDAFRANASGVLLATRGALGIGVSLEMTTPDVADPGALLPVYMIVADCANSKAEEVQLEGRIRRPLAQGYVADGAAGARPPRVQRWIVEYVRTSEEVPANIEDVMRHTVAHKEATCGSLFAGADADEGDPALQVDEGILAAALRILKR